VEPGTGRLEAFSDGVFAIAATLLVLEFTVNHQRDLGSQLVHLWPAYLAYVTSFVTIGIIWMNHHHTVALLGRVDRTFLFVNILLLLTVAFLPFPTKLVAEDLRLPGSEEAAVLVYTATLLLMAALHQAWWRSARSGRRLIADGVPDSTLRAVDRSYVAGVPAYAVAFLVGFFSPLAAVLITFAIAAFYLPSAALFDRGGEPG
jgi:uncharacterized membrane protein